MFCGLFGLCLVHVWLALHVVLLRTHLDDWVHQILEALRQHEVDQCLHQPEELELIHQMSSTLRWDESSLLLLVFVDGIQHVAVPCFRICIRLSRTCVLHHVFEDCGIASLTNCMLGMSTVLGLRLAICTVLDVWCVQGLSCVHYLRMLGIRGHLSLVLL